eukprot:358066-Chlamydomonas_euryale.AAC.2
MEACGASEKNGRGLGFQSCSADVLHARHMCGVVEPHLQVDNDHGQVHQHGDVQYAHVPLEQLVQRHRARRKQQQPRQRNHLEESHQAQKAHQVEVIEHLVRRRVDRVYYLRVFKGRTCVCENGHPAGMHCVSGGAATSKHVGTIFGCIGTFWVWS